MKPAITHLTALLLSLNGAGQDLPPRPARPLVGAIRWDAWHQAPVGNATAPVLAMERSLGPQQYQYRLPFFATVVSEQRVHVNGYTPTIMEQEIDFAKAGGVDYWAFLLYNTNSPMSQALSLYLNHPRRDDVRFCVIAGVDMIRKETARIVDLMTKPNYVKVAGGRPLVFVFRATHEESGLLEGLRSAAKAAGCGDPYAVAMNNTVANGTETAKAIGADAISAYAVPGHGGKNGTPYVELAHAARRFWEKAADAGTPLVPLAMAGWDRRPRIEHPVPWDKKQKPGAGLDRYYQTPTPPELAAHIKEAMTWVDSHLQQCPARAVLIYAWNEHDEGGWLCPTRGADGKPDTGRLDAIRNVLQSPSR